MYLLQLLGESLNINLAFQELGYMCASLRSQANLMTWMYLDTTENLSGTPYEGALMNG